MKDELKGKIKRINSILTDKEQIVEDVNKLYIHKKDLSNDSLLQSVNIFQRKTFGKKKKHDFEKLKYPFIF